LAAVITSHSHHTGSCFQIKRIGTLCSKPVPPERKLVIFKGLLSTMYH